MKLKLNSFRQHKDLELEFPESGLLMLKGKSGNGKTTIFDAIFEALYGEADDVVPWGASTASVELELFKPKRLKIKRTRGPHTLTVTDENDVTTKDDAAQGIINQTIGMTAYEFLACSYIQQGMHGSLLTLQPAEQLKFIQKLSMGLADPEKIKKALDNIIKTEKTTIDDLTIENEQLIKQFTELEERATSSKQEMDSIEVPEIHEDHPKAAEYLRETTSQLKIQSHEYEQINKTLASDLYDFLGRIPQMESDYQSLQEATATQVAKLQAALAQFDQTLSRLDVSGSEQALMNLRLKREVLKNIDEMKALASKINNDFPKSKEFKKVTEFLDAEMASATEKIESTKRELQEKTTQLKELQSIDQPQLCPECKTHLVVIKGEICKPSKVIEDLDTKKANLISDMKAHETTIGGHMSNYEVFADLKRQADRLKSKVIGDKMPEVKDLGAVEQLEADARATIEKHKQVTGEKMGLQTEVRMLNNRVAEAKTALENAHMRAVGVKPKVEVEARKEELWSSISGLNNKVQALTVLSNQYAEYLKAKSRKDLLTKDVNIHKEKKIEILEKQEKLKIKLEKSIERSAAATRAREINDFASMSAIELIVDQINSNAAEYLEKMFPNDGTQIIIKNVSMTKKGDERAKISLDIFHKGKTAKKIGSLSGGEKSRACLAFQLAVADLYKSPILLIDEGFAGLDELSKQECMEILKDVTSEKLVVVIEHGASESLFDEVVNI